MANNNQINDLSFLNTFSPNKISNALKEHSDQDIAGILVNTNKILAAQILADFPKNRQTSIVSHMRIAKSMPIDTFTAIISMLKNTLIPPTVANNDTIENSISYGGPEIAAAILRYSTPETLNLIKQNEPDLWNNLQNKMYTFDDLINASDNSLQIIFREIDTEEISVALKAAIPQLKERVLENLSTRRKTEIQNQLNSNNRIKMSDIEEAQSKILNHALTLQHSGKVLINSAEGQI
jgi:flagellar motor switch protein FliG